MADRLFSDVMSTWKGCLKSPSDVKELTLSGSTVPMFSVTSTMFNLARKCNSDVL